MRGVDLAGVGAIIEATGELRGATLAMAVAARSAGIGLMGGIVSRGNSGPTGFASPFRYSDTDPDSDLAHARWLAAER